MPRRSDRESRTGANVGNGPFSGPSQLAGRWSKVLWGRGGAETAPSGDRGRLLVRPDRAPGDALGIMTEVVCMLKRTRDGGHILLRQFFIDRNKANIGGPGSQGDVKTERQIRAGRMGTSPSRDDEAGLSM